MLHITHRAPTLRYKSLAQLRKAIEQRSENYWVDTDTGKRVPNPNKQPKAPGRRSKKPADPGNKPVPQSYNTDGEEPSSNTSGDRKVKKPKKAAERKTKTADTLEVGDVTKFDKQTQVATKPVLAGDLVEVVEPLVMDGYIVVKKAIVRPISGMASTTPLVRLSDKPRAAKNGRYVTPDGDVRNMNFKKIDDRIDLIKLSLTGEDPVAIQALADMEEEGTLDLPPRSDPRSIREMIEAHGTAGACRVLLNDIAAYAAGEQPDDPDDFTDRVSYTYLRCRAALGWQIGYTNSGGQSDDRIGEQILPQGPSEDWPERWPEEGAIDLAEEFVPRPKGGAVVLARDGEQRTTMTVPKREAYEKYEDAINQVIEAHFDDGVIRSNEFIAEVNRLAPSATPLEVWDAVAYMAETGYIQELQTFDQGVLEDIREDGGLAPDEPLDGFSANDGVLWDHGHPVVLMLGG